MVLKNLVSYKLQRSFGFPRDLPMNLAVASTYKCNSRCKTCFIWKINKFDKELKVDEFEKIFKKYGKNKLYLLTITGGEPFLNKDIDKISFFAEKYCNVKKIVIPTNAILNTYNLGKVKSILSGLKKAHLTINISLDGVGEDHDHARGIGGNYERVINLYKDLQELEKEYKNLDVNLHTVISRINYKDFGKIFSHVMNELKPKNYITEIAELRPEMGNLSENITPNYEEYSSAIDVLIRDLENRKLNVKQSFRLEYYKLVKEIIKKKTQVIPCYAGIASAQIDPTGEVWFCSLRAESIGNLRDVDYDFSRLWHNDKAKKQRLSITNKECYCPLANASYTNIALDFKSSFRVMSKFLMSHFKYR